jgi:hypothetical protein
MIEEKDREVGKFFLTLSQITYGVLILGAILSSPLKRGLLVLGIALAITFFIVALLFFRLKGRS